ncbi:hypothetical protein JCM6882_004301 [Rhodosporidiobolus microsporus]
MASNGGADGYWGYDDRHPQQQQQGGGGGVGAVGGFPSPQESEQRQQLHRTASEEVQQALSGSLGLTTGGSSGFTGRSTYAAFDPLDNARLSPSAFDPNLQFVLPRFASGGPSDPFGFGVGVADPPSSSRNIASPMPFDFNFGSSGQTPRAEQPHQPSPFYPSPYPPATASSQNSSHPTQLAHRQSLDHQQRNGTPSTAAPDGGTSNYAAQRPSDLPAATTASAYASLPAQPSYAQRSFPATQGSSTSSGAPSHLLAPTNAELESPIYAPYGSSVISVNSTPNTAYKMPALSVNLPPSQAGPQPFNPAELGLPAPPPAGGSNNFAGLYSASGFDMLGVLARVAARPNPQIQIGPVDMSCSFAVVDARRWDLPLVFVSDTFAKMTGYTNEEIIGRNCRFLQTPGGGTVQGAPRKYTDSNACWHMRQHIQAGKESQSSLINYTKGGRPFINLVTIIPICWDTEEIAYFVGFQVDLVDQPNAIMNRMRDGSYTVNYSLVGQQYNSAIIPNPSSSTATDDSTKTVSMKTIQAAGDGLAGMHPEPDDWMLPDGNGGDESPENGASAGASSGAGARRDSQQQQQPGQPGRPNAANQRPTAAEQMAGVGGEPSGHPDEELLDLVAQRGIDSLALEVDQRAFHKLLLGEADDFVHVLSLKGSVLYCSPSVKRILEYEPGELVGSTMSALCHPSDVVPVMRQLKDASSISTPYVKLLYRIRRKHSGWIWIEATGKLHIEPGKGRKCVIAVARPRDVPNTGWNELRQNGGIGDTEFFTKIGERGSVLFATSTMQSVLGFAPQEAIGCSFFDISLPEYRQQLEVALQQAQLGAPASVQHKMRNRNGQAIEVVTKFYPRHPEVADSTAPQDLPEAPLHTAIIAQTTEISSEQRKAHSIFGTSAPVYTSSSGASPAVSDTGSNSGSSNNGSTSNGAFQSTFKSLQHPSSISDNIFDELETRRPTSWQFELHQLQSMNKKLRDEKDYLLATRRAKRNSTAYSERSRKGSAASDTGSKASSATGRVCQNCGRDSSPEWRAGPNGKKTLCNSCGLRWAKNLKQASKSGNAPPGSPTSSTGSTLAAFAPMTISPAQSAVPSPQQYSFALPKVDEDADDAMGGSVWPPQQ